MPPDSHKHTGTHNNLLICGGNYSIVFTLLLLSIALVVVAIFCYCLFKDNDSKIEKESAVHKRKRIERERTKSGWKEHRQTTSEQSKR